MKQRFVIAMAAICAMTVVPPAQAAPIAAATLVDTFNTPVYVTGAPGVSSSTLLFVVEQQGVIRVLDDEITEPTSFLNITSRVLSGGERGLLSIAFPSDYETTRRFYVAFTNSNGDVEVAEYQRMAGNAKRALAGSYRRVLVIPHRDAGNHNGGQLQFGPDGFLYISIGDGGATPEKARRLNNLLGKILRINPTKQGSKAYTIPSNNPFVGTSGRRGEIYSYGLRNPWRFSFDGNRIAIADVGQGRWEEVNFLPVSGARGTNFGWPQYEGRTLFDNSQAGPHPAKMPMVVYSHNNGGCAVIGGYVSRDPTIPAIRSKYLYGDLCLGRILALTPDVAANRPASIVHTGITAVNLSSFGVGPNKRMYITQTSGELSRILEPR